MKHRWILWIVLALAAVPFGRWLGGSIEDALHDRNLDGLRKQQEIDRLVMAQFTGDGFEHLRIGMSKGEVTLALGSEGQQQALNGSLETRIYRDGDRLIVVTFDDGRLVSTQAGL